MSGRWWWLVFLGVIILAASQAHGATIPTDAVLLDSKEDYILYKSVEGLVEKTPTDQVYLYDAVTTLVKLVSCTDKGVAGDAYSDSASVSTDGNYVAFHTWARNLWPATPSCANVMYKDMVKGDVKMIRDHALSPAVSADGRYVAYEYNADPMSTLPAIYRYDVKTGEEVFIDYTSLGNIRGGWYMPNPQISDDGLTITYHTTKRGVVEVWEWHDGELKYIRSGTVTDAPIIKPVEEVGELVK